MPSERFQASRWTRGNHLFPAVVDARRIRDLVTAAQTAHLPAAADAGPTKACPFCAETIKQAAKICRYCQRELP